MSRLAVGEKLTVELDRISKSGNGIIDRDSGHINVGTVKESYVGETIEIQMLNQQFARCLTEEARTNDYSIPGRASLSRSKSTSVSWLTTSLPPVESGTTIDFGSDGNEEFVGAVRFCDSCGSVMRKDDDVWKCKSCGNIESEESPESSETTNPKTTSDDAENGPEPDDESSLEVPGESTDVETVPDSYDDLEDLRNRAEDSAVEEVPRNLSTETHKTRQYTRSSAVRRYVLARADGMCEGCGEPAPFKSKAGGPYLHAHHIHELSDDGSDTPDTVIALCPNCHYRVHHGADGEEYNRELLSTVQAIENEGQN